MGVANSKLESQIKDFMQSLESGIITEAETVVEITVRVKDCKYKFVDERGNQIALVGFSDYNFTLF